MSFIFLANFHFTYKIRRVHFFPGCNFFPGYHVIPGRYKTSGGVAQMVEQRTHKPRVGGSNPSTATNYSNGSSHWAQKTRKECSEKQREREKYGNSLCYSKNTWNTAPSPPFLSNIFEVPIKLALKGLICSAGFQPACFLYLLICNILVF